MAIHGKKYDYSLVIYKNSTTKVSIICKKHQLIFKQQSRAHLARQGCWKCAGRKPNQHKALSTKEFIKRAIKIHKNKYNYSKTQYSNSRSKVNIICKKHNFLFKQRASAHLKGKGCPKCGLEKSTSPIIDKNEFIKRANKLHKFKYDYSDIHYQNYKTKVKICCKKCSAKGKRKWFFHQSPNTHLQGHGCYRCGNVRNELERAWLKSVNVPDTPENRQVTLKISKNKHVIVDGFDKKTKTIYEFYGDYFHGNPKIYSPNDYNKLCKMTFGELYRKTKRKESLIKKAGYKLICMWESDFKSSID